MDKSVSDQVYLKDNQYIDEGYCHDNDLILAAELGKALLERNRQLEDDLQKAQNAEQERIAEIKFLQNQVTELRKFSTERALVVDEAERYYQDLQCENCQLLQERTADRERIHRLSTRVKQLEDQLRQLNDEASDDGQQQQLHSTGATFRSTRSHLNQSTTSRSLPPGHHSQPDVRSGFIDDELSDQPELLSLHNPTGVLASQRQHQLMTAGDARGRLWRTFDNDDGDSGRIPRFSSHPPAASRCYHASEPLKSADSLQPPACQGKKKTAPALFAAASSVCPHGCQSDNLVCLECFDSTREPKEPKTLIDGAAVMRELDRIYEAQLQCRLKAINVDDDRQPTYRQVFQEAFQMLRNLRKAKD